MPGEHLFESEESVLRVEDENYMIRFTLYSNEDIELRHSVDLVEAIRLKNLLERLITKISNQS